jgi:hypothetical protein
MLDDREAIAAALEAFGKDHPTWVTYDRAAESLLEIYSGRTLRLPLDEIARVEVQRNAVNDAPYLLLELKDGRQLALADAGIAFPPAMPPVPMAPVLPRTVCMRDFEAERARLEKAMRERGQGRPGREALGAAAACLGILEGARLVGLEISREQRVLEALFGELERHK